jgi:EAL domain-containing protein (putative c-di-GMP-specific phosphodiesterase class I)
MAHAPLRPTAADDPSHDATLVPPLSTPSPCRESPHADRARQDAAAAPDAVAEAQPALSQTTAASVRMLLADLRRRFALDVALVSHFRGGRRVVDIVDSSEPVAFGAGHADPVEDTYCQHIVDGRLPEVMPNVEAHPLARDLLATRALRIGAHLGVPIVLDGGEVFGTLCAYTHAARPDLDEHAATVLGLVADAIGRSVAADHDAWRTLRDVGARVDALLDAGLLTMAYQPIVQAASGQVVAVEALARFPASAGGSPRQWFDDAAQVGRLDELELAAVQAAARDLPAAGAAVDLHVNLSPGVLVRSAEDLLRLVPSDRLVIELTEHEIVEDYDALLHALAPLRACGVRIAVDHAGAGFASFRHALLLKPDMLKLDISLVRGIDTDRSKASLCMAIAGFAHATDAALVAEGVETAGEAAAMRTLGADLVQGYFYGRPGPLKPTARSESRSAAVTAENADVGAESAAVAAAMFAEGASSATVAAALNARGLVAPSGRRWHGVSVDRLLR